MSSIDETGPQTIQFHKNFSIVTWNVDGINKKKLESRTRSICNILLKFKPDIILLQEVVPESEGIFQEEMSHLYTIFKSRGTKNTYYTATFILKTGRNVYIKTSYSNTIQYKLSIMGRDMLIVKLKIEGITLNIVNTHLESTDSFTKIRSHQLQQLFSWSQSIPKSEMIVVAGDTNLTNDELQGKEGLPVDWIDVWESLGKNEDTQYTWDMTRNDNIDIESDDKPRFRFDRIWLRDSVPSRVTPLTFQLIGTERLADNDCFPSDHWGILTTFKLETFNLNSTSSCSLL